MAKKAADVNVSGVCEGLTHGFINKLRAIQHIVCTEVEFKIEAGLYTLIIPDYITQPADLLT